jgi:hypothetical protein
MYRRLHSYLALSAALLACGGCTQMTRHSNMVVFGTNTVVGLRVGTNATQVPSIDLGYTRQEAVLMPLVANTGNAQGQATGPGTLVPCNVGTDVKVVKGTPAPDGTALPEFVTHPCLLVATDNTDDRQGRDSYSVLASFGADFGASAEPSGAKARGGLAQYFATGMAAQLLALNGGAAVVAVGPAAEAAADNAPMALNGETGLTAAGTGAQFDTGIAGVRARALAITVAADRRSKMQQLLSALSPNLPAPNTNAILQACGTTGEACVAEINSNQSLLLGTDNFNTAVAAWLQT